jgi:hypothetical protein
MKKLMFAGVFLLLLGCGNRVSDPVDNTNDLLLGMWDSISNDASVCHERLRINSDRTFWWFDNRVTSAGTYGRDDDRLNFMYTNKPWEMVKFVVNDRELYLTRTGLTRMYTRVPITANSSPCPTEGKSL